jgi:hypothetical protein
MTGIQSSLRTAGNRGAKAGGCLMSGQAGGPQRSALKSSSGRSADKGGPIENAFAVPTAASCFWSVAACWLAHTGVRILGLLGWLLHWGRRSGGG